MNKDNENYEILKDDYNRILGIISKQNDCVIDDEDDNFNYNSVYVRSVLYQIKSLDIKYGYQEDTLFEYSTQRLPLKYIIELSKLVAYKISNNFGKFYESAVNNPHFIINKGKNKMIDGYTLDLASKVIENYVVCNIDYTLESIILLIHEVMHLYNCKYLILDNILSETFSIYTELVVNEYFLKNNLISQTVYNTNIRNLLSVCELVTIKECNQEKIKISDELQLTYIYGFILALYLKKLDEKTRVEIIDNLSGKITFNDFLDLVNITNDEFKNIEGIDKELKLMLK